MKKCTRCLKTKEVSEFVVLNKEFINCNSCRKKGLEQAKSRKLGNNPIVILKQRRSIAIKKGCFVCGACKLEKDVSCFHDNALNTKFNVNSICKDCLKTRQRFSKLKSKFDLTKKDIELHWSKIDGCCEICKEKLTFSNNFEKKASSATFDHCHTTGKFRGILCSNCNRALGLFKDNKNILENATKYLVQNKLDELLENPEVDNQQPS